MRSVFGWSLPPGVTTLPGEEDFEPPRCYACGRYVKNEVRSREVDNTYVEFYVCKQGHETIVFSADLRDGDF